MQGYKPHNFLVLKHFSLNITSPSRTNTQHNTSTQEESARKTWHAILPHQACTNWYSHNFRLGTAFQNSTADWHGCCERCGASTATKERPHGFQCKAGLWCRHGPDVCLGMGWVRGFAQGVNHELKVAPVLLAVATGYAEVFGVGAASAEVIGSIWGTMGQQLAGWIPYVGETRAAQFGEWISGTIGKRVLTEELRNGGGEYEVTRRVMNRWARSVKGGGAWGDFPLVVEGVPVRGGGVVMGHPPLNELPWNGMPMPSAPPGPLPNLDKMGYPISV